MTSAQPHSPVHRPPGYRTVPALEPILPAAVNRHTPPVRPTAGRNPWRPLCFESWMDRSRRGWYSRSYPAHSVSACARRRARSWTKLPRPEQGRLPSQRRRDDVEPSTIEIAWLEVSRHPTRSIRLTLGNSGARRHIATEVKNKFVRHTNPCHVVECKLERQSQVNLNIIYLQSLSYMNPFNKVLLKHIHMTPL